MLDFGWTIVSLLGLLILYTVYTRTPYIKITLMCEFRDGTGLCSFKNSWICTPNTKSVHNEHHSD